MKGIIFCGSSRERGNEKLKEIINKYKLTGIETTKSVYSKLGSWAEFENGDAWRVVSANDNARGHKCNVAYVERCIDYDIYRTLIMHCLIDFPFAAINLWGEGNLHITSISPLSL